MLGGNRAFMAEPSDRSAINDRLGRKKRGGVDMNKRNEEKKWEKNLTDYSKQIRIIQVDTMR